MFPQKHQLPAFVTCVIAAGALAGLLAMRLGDGSGDLPLLFSLVLAGAVSERFKVSLFGDSHLSVSAFLAMLAAVIGGPRDAVIVAALLGLSSNLAGVLPLHKTLFNVSVYVLSSLAFLGVYDGLSQGGISERTFGVVPATAAVLVDFAVNAMLVAIVIGMSSDRSPITVLRENHLWLVPHYLPLGVMLVAAVAGYEAAGAGVLVGFAIPIAGVQVSAGLYSNIKQSYARHVDGVDARIAAVQAELDRLQSLATNQSADVSAA